MGVLKHKKHWDEAKRGGEDECSEKKVRINGYLRPAPDFWDWAMRLN